MGTQRERAFLEVEALLRRGDTVLVWGPWGIGKSTWLAALRERAGAAGIPCGMADRTGSLGDATAALSRAYPEVDLEDRTQRQVRSALRIALEERPGLLLLDDLRATSTALRGFLRSLRGTGVGIGIAAGVEHPRDLERLRSLRIAYHQRAIPPLRGRALEALLDRSLPRELDPEDRRALARIARGRPGWVVRMGERLSAPTYWRGDRIRCEILRADVTLDAAKQGMGLDPR